MKPIHRENSRGGDSLRNGQEVKGKDIDRCFGVLQARFRVLRHERAYEDVCDVGHVSETCVSVHSMLVRMSQNNMFPEKVFGYQETYLLGGNF